MSWLFDGQHEINLKLERGQSFGLSKAQYGSLAHVAMGAFRWAGVEPCEIRLLDDEPGCDLLLWGHAFQFTIRMQPGKQRSTLYAIPLDSSLSDGPGVELYCFQFNPPDFVGLILATILRHEGVQFSNMEEAEQYLRDQGVELL